MGQSTDYWTFETTDEGKTLVTWGMTGELPFFLRFMSRGMDEAIGKDFNTGLEKLKDLIESQKPVFVIEEKNLQPTDMFYVSFDIFFIEMTDEWYQEAYKKIYNYLEADTAYITGNPTSIYHDWDEETERTIVDLAIPCASPKTGNNEVKKGTTPIGRTIYTTSYGNYDGLNDAHEALDAHMIKRGLEWNGPAMEVYLIGPRQTPDFDQWQTEIYYSVK
jgi:effector-binding domain-containing protein